MRSRTELFERLHAVVIRIALASEGKTSSFDPQVSHGKAGSGTPDRMVLLERYKIERPLDNWRRATLDRHGLPASTGIDGFHAALMVATAHELDGLVGALCETEVRLGIEWASDAHREVPAESATSQRDRYERHCLHRYFGLGFTEAAELEGVTEGEMRHIRRKHGISGRDGRRKEACPDALARHSVKDHCTVCEIVDDMERENTRVA